MSSDVIHGRAGALPTLTGVRGIAALAVFLCHAQPAALRVLGLDPDQGSAVIGSGFRGVDLFFILSGFILFHVHAHDFTVLNSDGVRRFYMLRFFRVYPLNTLVLLLLFPLPLLSPSFVDWHRAAHLSQGAYHARDFSWPAFAQSLLLAQTWTGLKLGTWNEPAWTLSAEVFGYACFPVLALLAGRLKSSMGPLLLVAGSLSAFVSLMIVGGHGTNNPSGTFGLIRMTLCFSAGIGLCRLYHMHPRMVVFAPWLAIVSVIEVLACFGELGLGVLSVFGFGGLIFALAYQNGAVASFTKIPVVMWLGRVSFSFYLIHLIPLEVFEYLSQASFGADRPAVAAMFVAALALPFVLAALLHRFAEVPLQKLGRTLSARPGRRAAPDEALCQPAGAVERIGPVRLGVFSNERLHPWVNWTTLGPPFLHPLAARQGARLIAPPPLSLKRAAEWRDTFDKVRTSDTLFWMQGASRPELPILAPALLRGNVQRAAFVVDAWKHLITKIGTLAVLQRLDPCFVAFREGRDELRRRFPRGRFEWLPFGVDTDVFDAASEERPVFAYWMGRRYEALHQAMIEYCAARDLTYRYTLKSGEFSDPAELGRLVGSARYFIVSPPDVADPQRTGGFSPFVMRYLEGLAAGARLLGVLPRSGEYERLLPLDAILLVKADGSDLAARLDADRDDAKGWEAASRARTLVREQHSWARRAEQVFHRLRDGTATGFADE